MNCVQVNRRVLSLSASSVYIFTSNSQVLPSRQHVLPLEQHEREGWLNSRLPGLEKLPEQIFLTHVHVSGYVPQNAVQRIHPQGFVAWDRNVVLPFNRAVCKPKMTACLARPFVANWPKRLARSSPLNPHGSLIQV